LRLRRNEMSYGATGTTGRGHRLNPLKKLDPLSGVKDVRDQVSKEASLCCGLSPPGGWKGPCGMLNIVGVAFIVMGIYGVWASYRGIMKKEVVDYLSAMLLVIASITATIAAMTHEGLRQQVDVVKDQNNQYGQNILHLKAQMNGFNNVERRLRDVKEHYQLNEEDLDSVIRKIDLLSDIEQVGTVMRAYTDADYFMGDKNRILQAGELDSFLADIADLLQRNLPELNLAEMKSAARNTGLTLPMVILIVNAMVTARKPDDGPARSRAIIALLLYSLDPRDNQRFKIAHESLSQVVSVSEHFGGTGLKEAMLEYQKQVSRTGMPAESLTELMRKAITPANR